MSNHVMTLGAVNMFMLPDFSTISITSMVVMQTSEVEETSVPLKLGS
jgi:hypothetical protein